MNYVISQRQRHPIYILKIVHNNCSSRHLIKPENVGMGSRIGPINSLVTKQIGYIHIHFVYWLTISVLHVFPFINILSFYMHMQTTIASSDVVGR